MIFRFLKDTLAVDASQHHVTEVRSAMLSSCSWHNNPTLVELKTESSAVYCGEESTLQFNILVVPDDFLGNPQFFS